MKLDLDKLRKLQGGVELLTRRMDALCRKDGGAFEHVERAVAQDPKVRDPAAVAAKIGMEKMGKKAFEAKAAAGRRDGLPGQEIPIPAGTGTTRGMVDKR